MTQKDQKGLKQPLKTLQGVLENLKGAETPRICTPLNDLPSRGQEIIDWAEKLINPRTGTPFILTPAQKFILINAHKIKEDGTWAHPLVCVLQARQNGKTMLGAIRSLWGMYENNERLQVATAHKLTTSNETFHFMYDIIEANPQLLELFEKKLEGKGSQEMKAAGGNRYLIRANNSASRGISSPAVIHLDEVREYKDKEVWAAMKFTQMASPNPQTWIYSNAGDQHSVILNELKDRALAAIQGVKDSIAWFEWSGIEGVQINPDNPEFWESIAMANPSLGYYIRKENIDEALHDDEDIIRTEVLNNWVVTISAVINPLIWQQNANKKLKLDKNVDTWMAIDLSPDRKHAALMASQRINENGEFVVALLNTWHNPQGLDDKSLANDLADWVKKYPTQVVAYSARTAAAVAARLKPAGIQIEPIDGQDYAQSCDEMLGAINSGRLKHMDQEELSRQALSAVKLPFGDGGWVMGRKVSNTVIAATVAMAMVSHYATQEQSGDDVIY